MKFLSWRKALLSAMVAGGLWVPCEAHAALINTNLIVDPGFEDVNDVTGAYNSLQLNSWRDGTEIGFTYASGEYDNGGPLSGGGARYFTTNGGVDKTAAGQFAQLVADLGTGETGAAIAAGLARYEFGGFFTNYGTQQDFAILQLDFRDASNSSLLIDEISTPDNLDTWTEILDGGSVPIGTESVLISIWGGVIEGDGGPDGYVDNVRFEITAIPEPSAILVLAVGCVGIVAGKRFRGKKH